MFPPLKLSDSAALVGADWAMTGATIGASITVAFLFGCIVCLLAFGLPCFAGSGVADIDNFHQVDRRIYRGAQPSEEGFRYLAKIGVKTVLDLREAEERSERERRVVTALGMRYVNVPMTGLTAPTPAQMAEILSLLEDPGAAVFVHCKRGADRTGAVIGAYRIDHDHWKNDMALKEALSDGMRFFQLPRRNYIRSFQPTALAARHDNPPVGPKAGTDAALAAEAEPVLR